MKIKSDRIKQANGVVDGVSVDDGLWVSFWGDGTTDEKNKHFSPFDVLDGHELHIKSLSAFGVYTTYSGTMKIRVYSRSRLILNTITSQTSFSSDMVIPGPTQVYAYIQNISGDTRTVHGSLIGELVKVKT